MKVFLISGKAQNGKDTAAGIIKKYLEEKNKRVSIIHYADLLKFICRSYLNWDGEKDEKGRELLQYVGTDLIREKEPDMWVDFVIKMLGFFEDEIDYAIIPDCRFPNEVRKMKSCFDTIHFKVVRPNFKSPLTVEQQNHPSETALDNYIPDRFLINAGTIDDFKVFIEEKLKLLNNLGVIDLKEGEIND